MPAKKPLILIFLFIIFAAAIGIAIYFFISQQNGAKSPEPLTASVPTVLWTDNRTLTILFTIQNPNKKYAANDFLYKINLYDDRGKLIKSIQKPLFIYAGETETLVEGKIDTGGNLVGRAEVDIENTNWVAAAEFKQPGFKTESLEASKESNFYKISAKIYNPNDFDISKIVLSAILYTKAGQELAAVRLDSDLMKAKRSKGLIAYVNISASMEQYLDLSATKFHIYVKK